MTETVTIGPPSTPRRRPPVRRLIALALAVVAGTCVVALVIGVSVGAVRWPRSSYSVDDVTRALEERAPSMLRPTAARWDPARAWWGAEWAGDLRVARGEECMLLWHLITIPGGQQRTGDWFDRAGDGWGARDLSPILTHRAAVYLFPSTADAEALTGRIDGALATCDEMVVTDAWGMYPERSTVEPLPLTGVSEDGPRLVGFTQSGRWKMTYFTIVVGQRHNVVTVDVVAGSDQTQLTQHVLGLYDELG